VTYEFMKRRVVLCKDGQPDRTVWLIVRRTLGEGSTYSYFISNAGRSTRLKTFVWLSGVRWAIDRVYLSHRKRKLAGLELTLYVSL